MLRCDHLRRLPTALVVVPVLLVLLLVAALPTSAEAKVVPVSQRAHISRRVRVSHRERLARRESSRRREARTAAQHRRTTNVRRRLVKGRKLASHATQSLEVSPRSASIAAPTSSTSVSDVAQFNRVSFDYSSQLGASAEANRYQFMVLQATNAAEIPLLKAANPNLKILIYQDPMLARPSDPTGYTVCSDWPDLTGTDSSWMLRDQNNNSIPDVDSAGDYLMNVGNPAYQQSCLAHAIALAKQVGADGVFLDDVNASVNWYLPAGVSDPEYPTASSWQSAETSFLSYATAQLHANGLLSVANIGGAADFPGLWAQWSSLVDGSMEQNWNNWSTGAANVAQAWPALLAEESWSEAHGKNMLLQSSDNGESENTFGLASMLLAAGGETSYSTSNVNFGSDEQWYPTYTAAQNLGAPLGPYSELPNGLYERAFTNGLVVVNPTSTNNLSLTLPATMTDSATGQTENTLTTTPTTGYILENN